MSATKHRPLKVLGWSLPDALGPQRELFWHDSHNRRHRYDRLRPSIAADIEMAKAFVRLRELIASHEELARKLEELESEYDACLFHRNGVVHASSWHVPMLTPDWRLR